jgi:protein-L-isoaspartate(D-aspartate) O-methyltransferase
MEDFATARLRMIESQLRTENVTARNVLSAMGVIPREEFVPEGARELAYIDRDVVINADGSRVMMRGAALARLLQLAEVAPTDRVLDIAAGRGYAAAILSRMAGSVVALESDPELAGQARSVFERIGVAGVSVVEGPLEAGYAAGAPYDVILIEGAVDEVPAALFDQLADEGRLIAVIGRGLSATATLFAKSDGQIGDRAAFNADILPLPAFRKPEVFVF